MEHINKRIEEYEGRLSNAELTQDNAKIALYLSIIDGLQKEKNMLLQNEYQCNLFKLYTTKLI